MWYAPPDARGRVFQNSVWILLIDPLTTVSSYRWESNGITPCREPVDDDCLSPTNREPRFRRRLCAIMTCNQDQPGLVSLQLSIRTVQLGIGA